MGMDTKIKIDLDKEMYPGGSEVRGAVDIKMRSPLRISKINLVFSKTTRLKIQEIERKENTENNEVEKIYDGYRHEFEIYSSDDPLEEVSSGHHRFPFRFMLRREDEGSLEIKGVYFDILCNIRSIYDLYAEIYILGVHNPAYTVRREIQIVDPIMEPRNFNTAIDVLSPICFLSRRYNIRLEVDKEFYYSGDCLVTEASIPSKKPKIKRMECFIYEILSVSVEGKEILRTKYIGGGEAEHYDGGRVLRASLKIPSTTPSTVMGSNFSIRVVLFINLELYRGTPVRIKKYIHVIKKNIIHPEIDCMDVLEGEIYPERILVLP
ncbi:putative thioredoxin-interacting protein [Encephalitozoon intestinalis]